MRGNAFDLCKQALSEYQKRTAYRWVLTKPVSMRIANTLVLYVSRCSSWLLHICWSATQRIEYLDDRWSWTWELEYASVGFCFLFFKFLVLHRVLFIAPDWVFLIGWHDSFFRFIKLKLSCCCFDSLNTSLVRYFSLKYAWFFHQRFTTSRNKQ